VCVCVFADRVNIKTLILLTTDLSRLVLIVFPPPPSTAVRRTITIGKSRDVI